MPNAFNESVKFKKKNNYFHILTFKIDSYGKELCLFVLLDIFNRVKYYERFVFDGEYSKKVC